MDPNLVPRGEPSSDRYNPCGDTTTPLPLPSTKYKPQLLSTKALSTILAISLILLIALIFTKSYGVLKLGNALRSLVFVIIPVIWTLRSKQIYNFIKRRLLRLVHYYF